MIDLYLSNGHVFIWSADDWLELRQNHRIVGELIGCLPQLPRQEILHGLPMMLLPEEVTLLLEKKIARLVEIPILKVKPDEQIKEAFIAYRERMLVEQQEAYREERTKQLLEMMDKIVEGKQKKMMGLKTSKKDKKDKDKPSQDADPEVAVEIEIDRNAIFEEELNKIRPLQPSDVLVQTHTAYPWTREGDVQEAQWNYPLSTRKKLRYKVFKDLWEKGFFVTLGDKFGGDFLAYPGDPIMFHSHFIVICKEKHEDISILDLCGQCRIACHVRKTQVFAYLSSDNQTVNYQSFQFENTKLL